MSKEFIVLPEDRKLAEKRIAELEREILELGEEFFVALRQSNETWHDNAAFDGARDKQSVLAAELFGLRNILLTPYEQPKPLKPGLIGVGSKVCVEAAGERKKFFIVGNWSLRIGKVNGGYLTVSNESPIGKILVGKKLGQKISMPRRDEAGIVVEVTS